MSSGPHEANQPAPPRRVYLAGPYTERTAIAVLAAALRGKGLRIASTWHDLPVPEHPTSDVLAKASSANHRVLRSAQAAVFVVHRGEPMETWVEFGAAFQRIPCLVLHHEGQRLPISVRTEDFPVESDLVPWWDRQGDATRIANRIEAWHGSL